MSQWWREEKGTTEGEMVGWHHRVDGHEFEKALGAGDGQEHLACCHPRGYRFAHNSVTEQAVEEAHSCSSCRLPETSTKGRGGARPAESVGSEAWLTAQHPAGWASG